jgi:hypothetical protein
MNEDTDFPQSTEPLKDILARYPESAAVMKQPRKTRAMPYGLFLRPFVGDHQFEALAKGLRSEEGNHFADVMKTLAIRIDAMPKTYEQDGKGNAAIAYLHYSMNGSDWYITEKDKDGGVYQAFGLAALNMPITDGELGYICIGELVANNVELDLYFQPVAIGKLKGMSDEQIAAEVAAAEAEAITQAAITQATIAAAQTAATVRAEAEREPPIIGLDHD